MPTVLKHYSSYRNGSDEMYAYDYWLKNAWDILERSPKISQKDKQLVRDLVDNLRVRALGTGRLAKHVLKLRLMLEILDVQVDMATRKDIERLVLALEEKHLRPVTLIDYLFILKRFFKFVKYGNVDRETPYPEEVAWIKRKMKPNEGRTAEFLTPSEVRKMIAAAEKMRDKAMIAVGFEGGFRTGELLGLDIRDLSFDDMGVKAKVRGKTGERIVRLISSAPLLTAYLETHRRPQTLTRPWGSPRWGTGRTGGSRGEVGTARSSSPRRRRASSGSASTATSCGTARPPTPRSTSPTRR
jgi:integrase